MYIWNILGNNLKNHNKHHTGGKPYKCVFRDCKKGGGRAEVQCRSDGWVEISMLISRQLGYESQEASSSFFLGWGICSSAQGEKKVFSNLLVCLAFAAKGLCTPFLAIEKNCVYIFTAPSEIGCLCPQCGKHVCVFTIGLSLKYLLCRAHFSWGECEKL